MTRVLVLIDLQLDYFPGGRFPLVDPDHAVDVAGEVLEHFRDRGEPIVHIQHVWDAPDAAFMQPGTPGVEIHPRVRPAGSEPVVRKAYPNSFRETELAEVLASLEATDLVVVGMMSSMCVDATVRAAADLGFEVTVVQDGCAAPNLSFGGVDIPGTSVHAAFMAALQDSYATVLDAAELLRHD